LAFSNLPHLVETIKERCRVCFTCIRECPAKAIRVTGGQAEIIPERCIGCGNCVKVCSQNAKRVISTKRKTEEIIKSEYKVAACIAPSFPAEFTDRDYKMLVGQLRALGFDYVVEVAAGADAVAKEYKNLISSSDKSYIASACPAVVAFIEKYYPELIDNLAPVASPMLATAKLLSVIYGENIKTVFIGPCIAKKNEAVKYPEYATLGSVLTFSELRELLKNNNIEDMNIEPSEFDPPHPDKGMIFPVGEGLLQTADLFKDLIKNDIVSAEGKNNFVEIIKEFSRSDVKSHFLDVLCCAGCIMGPGFTTEQTLYNRHSRISDYINQKLNNGVKPSELPDIDLEINFKNDDRRLDVPSAEVLREILRRMGKEREEDELNCGACGYETCIDHAVAIHKGIAESEMCLPYTIEKLKTTAKELASSYKQLEDAQNALIQSEKLASMGQLAAGIAHEINNPLGIIVLYTNLLFDKAEKDSEQYDDLKMIVDQANRCKTIVGGLLNFARKNKTLLKEADINSVIKRCVKAVRLPQNIDTEFDCGKKLHCDIDVEQMMQVFINLLTNSAEAMPAGGKISVKTENENDSVKIIISDTGTGIKKELLKKIFEPFFTTKQIGKGTGLGLAVTYGIIKMHNGNITVESNNDIEKGPTGTSFTITLPMKS
jgi:signal transduction histidine kinase/iron only hydrogenase large subunit-like protein